MVKIVRYHAVQGSQEKPNFIEEIKHLREYTITRYGIPFSSLQTKTYMEEVMKEQERLENVEKIGKEFKEIVHKAISYGYNPYQLIDEYYSEK